MHFCLTSGEAPLTISPIGDNISNPITMAIGSPIAIPIGIDFKCSLIDSSVLLIDSFKINKTAMIGQTSVKNLTLP